MVATSALIILLGAFGLIIPFIGPLFGFGMGMDPQPWVVTTSRVVRHVLPGAAIIVGGAMMLPRLRAARAAGATLALVGGIWLAVAPVVLGRGGEGVPAVVDILRPLAYHYGTGVVVAALAAFGLGRHSGRRAAETARVTTAPAGERESRTVPAR